MFEELKKHKNGARTGLLKTRVASVKTPFFMPVATRGAVKSLEPAEVAATGAEVLLANTYHLHLAPGEKIVKKLGGLHVFTGWHGPILTDSGGFQVFSLSNIRKITEEGVIFKDPSSGREILLTPEKSMKIQLDLGADIIMAFDDLTGLDPAKEKVRTEEAVERTHRWLSRCITEFKKLTKNQPKAKRPLLFGIAQGGLDKKLRQKSIEFVQSQEIDGLAIGGLSVGVDPTDVRSYFSGLSYEDEDGSAVVGTGTITLGDIEVPMTEDGVSAIAGHAGVPEPFFNRVPFQLRDTMLTTLPPSPSQCSCATTTRASSRYARPMDW